MKNRVFLSALVFAFIPLIANAQIIEWQKTIGGSWSDDLYCVQQTADGGYILGGTSSSNISGNKTENCLGGDDYWIVKTDSSGTIQWQNTIGGSLDDILFSIQQTSDGGYILGGHSRSNISGDKTENSNGYYDYWIVKTDASGTIQWQNTIGGSDYDFLYCVDQTNDGGYILGGYSWSNISGDKTENSLGADDYWIVKTDAFGAIQWQNTIGGSSVDNLLSLEQTADGGYILGGHSYSNISGDKTENNYGNTDFWIIKTDSTGNIQWQNTIGGGSSDVPFSIGQTDDGGYIMGGHSYSNISGDKTENCIGAADYWIVKTDSSGVIQWQNTIGSNSYELLQCIKQTTDGGYILGGYSNCNISGDKTENCIGMSDYWIVKTDNNGIIEWQNTIGGNGIEYLYFLQPTNDGGFILGGASNSYISGDKTENFIGMTDYWIVKITDDYNSIKGKLFIDANGNSIMDAGESALLNKKVVETITGNFDFSKQGGEYNVTLMNSGNFSVSPEVLNYYTIVPGSHNVGFTGIQQTDSLNDFAFQPVGVFNDLCVTNTPLGPFRAGFNASYLITYENVGTTTLTPTVIFFPDADLNFVSATPVASTITIDSIVWNFGPISPFQQGTILVTVNVNTGVPIGTLINSGAMIEPVTGDANTGCNYSFWEVLTTGSYDPNDILVDEDTLLTYQFPSPPYLEYLIRFQNTGNDTAFTVKVLNPIDTFMLDLSSIEFVASSHPVHLSWIPWERNMQFMFDNILLPDSNVNEPASHGFIRYRIKPKTTLTAGDSITNSAAIYFDFNAPVVTNSAITRILLPTSLHELSATDNHLLLYPNPANSTLTVVAGILPEPECRLIISDVAGRTMYSKSLTGNSTKHNIDISTFSGGVYFVELRAGERISRGRFVKE